MPHIRPAALQSLCEFKSLRKRGSGVAVRNNGVDDPIERIARLLAIIAVRGLDNEEAARRLLAAGFDAKKISGLLGVNPNFETWPKHGSPKPRLRADAHDRPASDSAA
jgi:hypothetical protein